MLRYGSFLRRLSVPAWALIGSLVLFAFAAWWQNRRFADTPLTCQQALAYVDPRLLPPGPDPAALERGKKLLDAAKFLDDPDLERMWYFSRSYGLAGISTEDQKSAMLFLSHHRKDLEKLQVLLEGTEPVELPKPAGSSVGRLVNWTDPYILLSRISAAHGDKDLATELLADAASRFPQESRFTGPGLREFAFYPSALSLRAAAQSNVRELPLSSAQYISILQHMPPSEPGFPAVKASLQFYFRDQVLPEILNARKNHGDGNGYPYGVIQLDDRVRQTASYDTVKTLKTLAGLYRQCLDSLDQPWSAQFMSLDAPIQIALKSIPSSLTSSSASGVPRFWDPISRSYLYRSSPNLLGNLIVAFRGDEATSLASGAPMMRTWYESSRAMFAVCVYRKRHSGRLPLHLDELVRERIIDSLPSDPYCGQPFRYDPSRGVLWSIGPDQVDDGGTSAASLKGPRDLVVRLL